LKSIRRPSPALVVAVIALFVTLSGTAVAARPVARALFANNAGKLQGRTRVQVVAEAVAAVRPPAVTSVRGLVSSVNREFFALPGSGTTETVACTSGRAISVYWTTTGNGAAVPSNITPVSESSWRVIISNLRTDGPAQGTLTLVCIT
jgi:hypothetical protein